MWSVKCAHCKRVSRGFFVCVFFFFVLFKQDHLPYLNVRFFFLATPPGDTPVGLLFLLFSPSSEEGGVRFEMHQYFRVKGDIQLRRKGNGGSGTNEV